MKKYKVVFKAEFEVAIDVMADDMSSAKRGATKYLQNQVIGADHIVKPLCNHVLKMKATQPLICTEVIDTDHTKLIKQISEFVGEGGLCPFEHGYKPPHIIVKDCLVKMWGVTDTEVCLTPSKPIAKKIGYRASLAELSCKELNKIWTALQDYLRYCKEEA